MSKKLLALLLALVMIVGSFTSVLADPVKEEPKKDDSKPAVTEEKKEEPAKTEEKKDEKSEEKKDEKSEEKKEEKKEEVDEALVRAQEVLKKAGIISGYSKDSEDFKAEKNVTRAEFASMIVRALNLEASAKSLATVPTGFKDVPTNLWANGYIAVAKQQGIINGYPNGTFQPNRQISYQDMATMLTIALGKAEVGTVYPAGYIVKAQQLGLFNKVDVPAYTDMATRGNVFKMVYNMVTSKEFGKRKIVKAIVLENNRVEKIGKDEIVAEVIDVVQQADWADASRSKKGEQVRYTLDKELKLDAEDLLGKVVDITTDKDGKIVEVKRDDTYDYKEGAITNVTRSKIGINWKDYTVGFDERYDSTDERIFRTYLNDKNYSYRDFADKYTGAKYDFARITMKNGKVIFIDAYKFDDVAPVTNAKDGDVYYRDDTRNANEYKAAALRQVIFHYAKGFAVAEIKDIAKDDVIHFYDDGRKAVVRKDAKVEDQLIKTHVDEDKIEYAVGKNAEYELNLKVKGLMPISSLEGKYFNVVYKRGDLEPIYKDEDKVTILLALDDTVQLIESAKAWKDGVHVVKKITGKADVQLMPPKGEKFWATETRDTVFERYSVTGPVNYQRIFDFNFDDIVYYSGNDKNEINKMGVIVSKDHYKANCAPTVLTPRFITRKVKDYRYFDGLKAFYLDKDNQELQQIEDWDTFYKYNKDNKDLTSYVISEKELKDALTRNRVDSYNFLSNADDIASIVVFNNVVETKYDTVYAEVKDLWKSTDEARFIDAEGKEYLVDLVKYPKAFGIDDIVKLNLDKASLAKKEKSVKGYVSDVVIRANQETVQIRGQRPTNEYLMTENNGVSKTVYFDRDTNVFSKQSTLYAQVYFADKNNFVTVIRYMRRAIGSTSGIDADLSNLEAGTNHYELIINGERVPVTNGILFMAGNTAEYGRRGYLLTKMYEYIGGKVRVLRDTDGKVISVEGVRKPADLALVSRLDILNYVKSEIEKLGVKELKDNEKTDPAAKNAFQADVDALLAKLNAELFAQGKIVNNVKAAVAYKPEVPSAIPAIPTVKAHFETTLTFNITTANAEETAANAASPVVAMNDAKILNAKESADKTAEEAAEAAAEAKAAKEEAENIFKAIKKFAEGKIAAIEHDKSANTYTVKDALVKDFLAASITNPGKQSEVIPGLKNFDKAKLTVTVAPATSTSTDGTTKVGTYTATLTYNGETTTMPVELITFNK